MRLSLSLLLLLPAALRVGSGPVGKRVIGFLEYGVCLMRGRDLVLFLSYILVCFGVRMVGGCGDN